MSYIDKARILIDETLMGDDDGIQIIAELMEEADRMRAEWIDPQPIVDLAMRHNGIAKLDYSAHCKNPWRVDWVMDAKTAKTAAEAMRLAEEATA